MKFNYYLMAEFNTAMIPLSDVAQKYLNMSDKLAKQKAAVQGLPFPVAKGSSSQKSGWFVFIDDLAIYLQEQHEKGRKQWEEMRNN